LDPDLEVFGKIGKEPSQRLKGLLKIADTELHASHPGSLPRGTRWNSSPGGRNTFQFDVGRGIGI
jgi:hypothetical protein